MRGGQWHANDRTDLATALLQESLQLRERGIRVPVRDVQGFLGVVNVPTCCFLDWNIREGDRVLSPPAPFYFVGIFLKDEDVEMVEADEFAQLVYQTRRGTMIPNRLKAEGD